MLKQLDNAQVQLKELTMQVDELEKCIYDPVYFIRNYYMIIHPVKGRIKFNLYDFQEDMIHKFQNNLRLVVKAARQTGQTDLVCAYLLWLLLSQSNHKIGIIPFRLRNGMEMLERIYSAYYDLPDWIKANVVGRTKTCLELDNGSRITVFASNSYSMRGSTINTLILPDMAYIPHHIQNEMWTNVQPYLAHRSKCIVYSTPYQKICLFRDLYEGACNGINAFFPIDVMWYQIPGRGESFKREQIKLIGKKRWKQEFELDFNWEASED